MATHGLVKKVGRPPKKPDERLVVVSIRLSPAQAESLKKLGGSRWIREQLNHDNPTIQYSIPLNMPVVHGDL